MFDEAKPLGERGLRWLKIHLANMAGYDKASFDEREAYAMEHLEDVFDSADNPLGVGPPFSSVFECGARADPYFSSRDYRANDGGSRPRIPGSASRRASSSPPLFGRPFRSNSCRRSPFTRTVRATASSTTPRSAETSTARTRSTSTAGIDPRTSTRESLGWRTRSSTGTYSLGTSTPRCFRARSRGRSSSRLCVFPPLPPFVDHEAYFSPPSGSFLL